MPDSTQQDEKSQNKTIGFRVFLHRKAFVLSFLLCVAFASLFVTKGFAQDYKSSAIPYHFMLSDKFDHYPIADNAFIVEDPDNLYDYGEILELYKTKKKGRPAEKPYLNLGLEGAPHWVVFSVTNRSDTERWVLNFGKRSNGRIGFIDKLFVYEHYSRTNYFNGLPDKQGKKGVDDRVVGGVLPIALSKSKPSLVVLYVVPYAGMPSFLPLALEKEKTALKPLENALWSNVTHFLAIAFSILFLGVFALNKRLFSLLFALYYLVFAALLSFHDSILYDLTLYAQDVMIVLFCLMNLVALLMTRLFVQGSIDSYNKNITFMSGAVSLVVLTLVGGFLLPSGTIVQPIFLWGTFPLTVLIAFFLSVLHIREEQTGTLLYMLGLVVSLIGFFLTVSSVAGFSNSPWMFSAFDIAVLIQAIFMFGASKTAFVMDSDPLDDLGMRRETSDRAFEKIKQSKESAELKRLLSVIEKERQVMHELRERDAQKTEEMRVAKESADKANGAKSAFLAVVSHEIRTPMTGVMGIVKLLLDTKLSKDQRDYAQTIQDSGNAMMALLNDILDFEKIEKGKMDLEHISFDLHRLIRSVHTLMSGHASAKSIGLVLDLEDSVPRFVMGDPTRLRQVLLNLTGNAIKFTSDGDVTIHVRNVVDAEEDEKKGKKHAIYFAVQDSGIGISAEGKKNLFTPFAQADSSISRKFGGTGLGLAICKSLVKAMGGDISISSKENEGSTFFFTLEMEGGDEEGVDDTEKAFVQEDDGPTKELSILVVDDNQINQKVLQGFLTKMGHKSFPALSGEEALQNLKLDVFDLILMDVNMPGMSGLEATQEIRKLPNEKSSFTPVVAMTGNTMEDDIKACFDAGMDDYLAKPIDTNKLAEVIRKVINAEFEKQEQVPSQTESMVPAEPSSSPSPESVPQTSMPAEASEPAQVVNPAPASEQAPMAAPAVTQSVQSDVTAVVPDAETTAAQETAPKSVELTFTDEELDEDSFEEAVRIFGEDEKESPEPKPIEVVPEQGPETVSVDVAESMPAQAEMQATESAPVEVERSSSGQSNIVEEEELRIERPPIAAFADTVPLQSQQEVHKPQSSETAPSVETQGTQTASLPEAGAEQIDNVFDEQALSSLKGSLPKDQFTELLDGMFEKTDELVDALKALAGSSDATEVIARAHELKGMTSNFGLTYISALAKDIEMAAKGGDLHSIPERIEKLPDAAVRSRKALEDWINS